MRWALVHPSRDVRPDEPGAVPLWGDDLLFVELFRRLAVVGEVVAFLPGRAAVSGAVRGLPSCPPGERFDVALSWGSRSLVQATVSAVVGPPSPSVPSVLPPPGCSPWRLGELRASGVRRVPGRVLWASPPSAGLHLLMEAWPSVLRSLPGASLHVAGDLLPWLDGGESISSPTERGMAWRAREAGLRLESLPGKGGVRLRGPLPYAVLEREMAEAEVLVGPLLPSSGRPSQAVMEALAFGVLPVLGDVPSQAALYRGAFVPHAAFGVGDAAARALSDPGAREASSALAGRVSASHSWGRVCEALVVALSSRVSWLRHGGTGWALATP